MVYKEVQERTNNGLEYCKCPDGYEFWYSYGIRHRPDGPAVKYPDGRDFWFLNGTKLDEDQVRTFNYLRACPLKELPLYINTIFKPIVERRLKDGQV